MRTRLLAGLATAAALAALSGPACAVAAPTPAPPADQTTSVPQLSVHIDNGTDQVEVGDPVRYQVSVDNSGADPVQIRISSTPPRFMGDVSADADGRLSGREVSWTSTVEPGAAVQVNLTGTFAEIPTDQIPRAAVTACVFVETSAAPFICSTDIDPILTANSSSAWRLGGVPLLAAVVAGVLLLAAVVAGVVVLRRRRPELLAGWKDRIWQQDRAGGRNDQPAETRQPEPFLAAKEPELASVGAARPTTLAGDVADAPATGSTSHVRTTDREASRAADQPPAAQPVRADPVDVALAWDDSVPEQPAHARPSHADHPMEPHEADAAQRPMQAHGSRHSAPEGAADSAAG